MGLAHVLSVRTARPRSHKAPEEHAGLSMRGSGSRLCKRWRNVNKNQIDSDFSALEEGALRLDCAHLRAVKYESPAACVGTPGKLS